MRKVSFFLFLLFLFTSCSLSKKLERSARKDVLSAEVLKTAHVGINVYEPVTGKTWFDYQGDKYFVPASNTKIPTCYAAMKYLGDSLAGLRYQAFSDTAINIFATGDPTFLHSDFRTQPVLHFLQLKNVKFYLSDLNWKETHLGSGWSWNDYDASYMVERSPLPINGNLLSIRLDKTNAVRKGENRDYLLYPDWQVQPKYFKSFLDSVISLPLATMAKREMTDSSVKKNAIFQFAINRSLQTNEFKISFGQTDFVAAQLPFVTNGSSTALEILKRDLGLKIQKGQLTDNGLYGEIPKHLVFHTIHSHPTDSLLRPMMHRSDNFFAEQSLLMVSNELLGYMNDEKIIDTLLKTDFKDLPQKPRWVDGSGLSRYNLFTPQDFVFLLNKMRNEFGMPRLKNILATGGEGTLSNYYKTDSTFLYAKTGSLSGVVALSGFLTTKKGKDVIFSVQVNNHNGSATEVRRAVEKFVQGLRERY